MVESWIIKDLPKNSWDAVKPFYPELPEDKYAMPGFRFRTFDTFSYDNRGYLVKQRESTFTQSSEINSAFGDLERKFESIPDAVVRTAAFEQMFETYARTTGITENIGCHMVRIVPSAEGVPAAPEGPHHDGFDVLGVFVVDRVNTSGGNFIVYNTNDEELVREDTLGKAAFLNDRDYKHNGDELVVLDNSQPAWWDWFVLTGNYSNE